MFFLVLTASQGFPQGSTVIIQDVKPGYEDNKFPTVRTPANPKIAEKINIWLQLNYLEHVPGSFRKHPFEQVVYEPDAKRSYTSFFEWKHLETPKNLLSLTIDGESTGAYPEAFTTYENFDLQTGDPILLKNLFSTTGIKALEIILNRRIKKTITAYVRDTKKELSKNTTADSDVEAQLDMYNECLDGIADNTMEYYSFFLGKDSITFVRGRCSNHANLAIDDLGTFYEAFSYAQITKYLSPLGMKILNGVAGEKLSSIPEGKIFKGTIDRKHPITVVIDKIYSDGSVSIKYWYDKYKQVIDWRGIFKHGYFKLTEEVESMGSDDTALRAKIAATWTENKNITGVWTDQQNNKSSELKLHLY